MLGLTKFNSTALYISQNVSKKKKKKLKDPFDLLYYHEFKRFSQVNKNLSHRN